MILRRNKKSIIIYSSATNLPNESPTEIANHTNKSYLSFFQIFIFIYSYLYETRTKFFSELWINEKMSMLSQNMKSIISEYVFIDII